MVEVDGHLCVTATSQTIFFFHLCRHFSSRMADGKVSIELAFVQVIALLKKVKRGYSLEDIEAKTGLHVRNNTKLQDLLFNHQHLHWDGMHTTKFHL